MDTFTKKIPEVSRLVAFTVLNTKLKEGDLVNKTAYDAKILGIKKQYFTTSDYNKFTSDALDSKIKQKELVNKCNI